MSAFMCSFEHLVAMAATILRTPHMHNAAERYRAYNPVRHHPHTFLVERLYEANAAGLCAEYGGDPGRRPGRHDAEPFVGIPEAAMVAREDSRELTPVQIIKMAQCFRYQCFEPDSEDFDALSVSLRTTNELIDDVIGAQTKLVTGYNAAVWGYASPKRPEIPYPTDAAADAVVEAAEALARAREALEGLSPEHLEYSGNRHQAQLESAARVDAVDDLIAELRRFTARLTERRAQDDRIRAAREEADEWSDTCDRDEAAHLERQDRGEP